MISEIYIQEIKKTLLSNPVIEQVTIIKERAFPDQGYFRARLILYNGDFLEVAEFFKVEGSKCIPITYRYQWMDQSQTQLKKRWDNVEHFPNLDNFPHHVHIGEESNVYPSISRNILEIIDLINQEV